MNFLITLEGFTFETILFHIKQQRWQYNYTSPQPSVMLLQLCHVKNYTQMATE